MWWFDLRRLKLNSWKLFLLQCLWDSTGDVDETCFFTCWNMLAVTAAKNDQLRVRPKQGDTSMSTSSFQNKCRNRPSKVLLSKCGLSRFQSTWLSDTEWCWSLETVSKRPDYIKGRCLVKHISGWKKSWPGHAVYGQSERWNWEKWPTNSSQAT